MKKIKCFFGYHKWEPKQVKYPIRTWLRYNITDGTAVYWECSCGKKKVTEHPFCWKIWHGNIIHVLED